MIERLKVKNVRLFNGKSWEFPLSPLTILCGTNNSGKSTLLQIVLLLRQSLGIEESYSGEEGRLRFVGSQVDLGDYYTFVSHNDYDREICIGLTTSGTMPASVVNRLRALNATEQEPCASGGEEGIAYSLVADFSFQVIPEREETTAEYGSVTWDGMEQGLVPSPKGFLKEAVYELRVSEDQLLGWRVVCSGVDEDGDPEFDIVIPEPYFESKERLCEIVADRESEEGHAKTRVILRGLLPSLILAKLLPGTGESDERADDNWVAGPLPFEIFNALEQLRRTLARVHYIGPLRAPVKRYYVTQPNVTPPLDPAGEFLPHILRDIGAYEAWYVPPGLGDEPKRVPLFVALNGWMQYIRTGEKSAGEIRHKEIASEITRALVEINIRSAVGEELHPLADSGFGYSQLLPIIIRGLLAARGSTIIVEQPELHLNPAIQVRAAEFLAAMTLAGKQVLVETHSEHIVNTLRVLSAEEHSGNLASMLEILYIDVEHGRPLIHRMSVQEDGTVPEWPRQFFGEAASLTGRLLRAQKRPSKQTGEG